MTADKKDLGKRRMELMPVRPLEDIADVYTFGATKYTPNGWRDGIEWSRIVGAIKRHTAAWERGEDLDPESGLPHLAHAAWGYLTLLEYSRTHPELDDRYKDKK